ncbi:MAG: GNAT family N-acetyltransferase [Candidatus Latescibacteria bacterium]|jgi:hypothetical protein|nr:GNAT family N-acetyltransferase [Candidatus Latescibacterota bacterium]
MNQQEELLQIHIETLYVLDDNGDMRATNWPREPGRRRAPAFHLGWTERGYVSCFRHDVPTDRREQVRELVASQWPFPSLKGPPEKDRYVEILSDFCRGRRGSGPVYIVPEGELPAGDATPITRDNVHVLEAGFAGCIEEVDATQPSYAVVVDGQAVSVCRTVRRSGRGIEAGIDTLEGHRRKGYARRAVAAWGRAAQQEGLIGFYSTSWSNAASCALADSVGLEQFAVEFSVS